MATKTKQTKAAEKVEYPTAGFARPVEAAAFLTVSVRTIYRMIENGEIASQLFRGCPRIPWEALHGQVDKAMKRKPAKAKKDDAA